MDMKRDCRVQVVTKYTTGYVWWFRLYILKSGDVKLFFFANNSFQPTFPQTFEPHASMDPRAYMFALQMQEMQQMLHWQAMARYNAWLRQLQTGDRTWAIPHAQPHQGVGSYQKKISLSANDNVRQ